MFLNVFLFSVYISAISASDIHRRLLTNHVYHWTRMSMTVQLCNYTQSPYFKARGEITAMLGNCTCPSWSTTCPPTVRNNMASDHINGHLIDRHDHRHGHTRHDTRRDAMEASDWTPISKYANDACATQVDFGYRKLTNGYVIEYIFDDAYDFDTTIDTTRAKDDSVEVILPNAVTLFLRSYDKKARVFVENIFINVSYFRQNFDQDETPIEWRTASVREYQYPDVKGNPVLDTNKRLVLELVEKNGTDAAVDIDETNHNHDESLPRTFKIDEPSRQPRNMNVSTDSDE